MPRTLSDARRALRNESGTARRNKAKPPPAPDYVYGCWAHEDNGIAMQKNPVQLSILQDSGGAHLPLEHQIVRVNSPLSYGGMAGIRMTFAHH